MFYGWYIVIAGTVVSPPIAGWVYDSLGTYGPIWLILGGLALVGAIIMFILPSPDTGSETIDDSIRV